MMRMINVSYVRGDDFALRGKGMMRLIKTRLMLKEMTSLKGEGTPNLMSMFCVLFQDIINTFAENI